MPLCNVTLQSKPGFSQTIHKYDVSTCKSIREHFQFSSSPLHLKNNLCIQYGRPTINERVIIMVCTFQNSSIPWENSIHDQLLLFSFCRKLHMCHHILEISTIFPSEGQLSPGTLQGPATAYQHNCLFSQYFLTKVKKDCSFLPSLFRNQFFFPPYLLFKVGG